MRAFSIQGPYGISISLATAMPAKFNALFPQSRRAASEPAASPDDPLAHTKAAKEQEKEKEEEVLATVYAEERVAIANKSKLLPRAPSPVPTEIDDPEPEFIIEQLHTLNIKVRDFAYPASSPSHSPSSSSHSTPSAKPFSAPAPHLAFETFDPYKGISEFEYRLSQQPRTYPIEGRTLRRLLDLNWVGMPEAKARLHQIDWEAMKLFDARPVEYAWRACRWREVPTREQRERLLAERRHAWVYHDKILRMGEEERRQEEKERRLLEEAEERVRMREEEREGGMGMVVGAEDGEDGDDEEWVHVHPEVAAGKKRALEHTSSTPEFAQTHHAESQATAGSKRARISDAPAPSPSLPSEHTPTPPSSPLHSASHSQSQLAWLPTFVSQPPPQQYPAPLRSYNPALYPDAKRVIEAEERPPVRLDTPPLETEEEAREREKEKEGTRPGIPLTRREPKRRSLSRGHTFRMVA
ncbi:hypothetical protein DXG03_000891 [Asterophora parasitica]|uniref:Uncharacterized protein n=1 Tax=Asterophora parasitica TaxID=117018 RepID=A0A9P7G5X2_9AGAR|nr:hypothetical protein DXG03_000891 [Asterophora parasitica]